MAGVVLETLSWKKLIALGIFLLVIQIVFFLVGGIVMPKPNEVQHILGTKCIDTGGHIHKSHWYFPRGEGACDALADFQNDKQKIEDEGISANQIVFAFQFPNPRENTQLKMYKYFQYIIGVLGLEIVYDEKNPVGENAVIQLEARIGYKNEGDGDGDWKELAKSTEQRTLECTLEPNQRVKGNHYECKMLSFFEYGSVFYDHYLVNIRVPVHERHNINMYIGQLNDIWVYIIHATGGFTLVWYIMKTVVFPILLIVMIWFWRRITQLPRPPNLLEKCLFALGLSLTFLNLPIEWLTLAAPMPFMTLIGDIRQGLFYSFLMVFWIIFAGEHMMDTYERNRISAYWKHLSAVIFGCICLFIFEICERGVQLSNPFYSIWVTDTGTKLGMTFIVLAGIAGCCYFLFLLYMIVQVFRNIRAKGASLLSMSSARRKYYQGLIYRFRFLMLTTLYCAAMTVIFFIISQVSEGNWKWNEDGQSLEYTSAFFTGVYGMWNIYVFALMVLYAPSHKYAYTEDDGYMEDDSNEETIQFSQLASGENTGSALASFARKAAAD